MSERGLLVGNRFEVSDQLIEPFLDIDYKQKL